MATTNYVCYEDKRKAGEYVCHVNYTSVINKRSPKRQHISEKEKTTCEKCSARQNVGTLQRGVDSNLPSGSYKLHVNRSSGLALLERVHRTSPKATCDVVYT
jgi:hypothetical protein